jgi:DNA-binding IscR family transcriptional regulator
MLHMAARGEPMTSEALAECLHTNAVVVRRTMAALRDADFVRSESGHGGGWSIARDLDMMTLRDVNVALGQPPLFAVSEGSGASDCLVEQTVHGALGGAFLEAQTVMMERLRVVTLAQLAADFQRRLAACRHGHLQNHHHHKGKAPSHGR